MSGWMRPSGVAIAKVGIVIIMFIIIGRRRRTCYKLSFEKKML